jgi:hypothetical protein
MNQVVTNAAEDENIIPIMKAIDWSKVPNAPVTSDAYGDTYPDSDPYCWWYVLFALANKHFLFRHDNKLTTLFLLSFHK